MMNCTGILKFQVCVEFWLWHFGTSVKIKVDLCEGRGYLEWISPTVLGLQVMSNNEISKDFLMTNLQASHTISWSAHTNSHMKIVGCWAYNLGISSFIFWVI
ncbi:hypothetical protein QQ045_015300 [Rhodiola kirilowii]